MIVLNHTYILLTIVATYIFSHYGFILACLKKMDGKCGKQAKLSKKVPLVRS